LFSFEQQIQDAWTGHEKNTDNRRF
jgi:hypothetical protein